MCPTQRSIRNAIMIEFARLPASGYDTEKRGGGSGRRQ